MPKSDAALVDMLIRARAAIQFAEGHDLASFRADTKTQFAVLHALTLIGEAAKRVDEASRAVYPLLPWRSIAGARDMLVHEYHRVALDVVWEIVQRDLPMLVEALRFLDETRD